MSIKILKTKCFLVKDINLINMIENLDQDEEVLQYSLRYPYSNILLLCMYQRENLFDQEEGEMLEERLRLSILPRNDTVCISEIYGPNEVLPNQILNILRSITNEELKTLIRTNYYNGNFVHCKGIFSFSS